MLRKNRKIRWTRTELKKFAEYEAMEREADMEADSFMAGVTVGSKEHKRLKEIGEQVCALRKQLKSLMGTTRFEILENDHITKRAWRDEVRARLLAKYPLMDMEDCWLWWE